MLNSDFFFPQSSGKEDVPTFFFFFFSPPVAQILFRNKLELEVNPVFGVSTLRL